MRLFSKKIKKKMSKTGFMKTFRVYRFLCFKIWVAQRPKNNKIVLIKNNKTFYLTPKKAQRKLGIKVVFYGDGNVLTIKNPKNLTGSELNFGGNNSLVEFKNANGGEFHVGCYDDGCKVVIGEETTCCSLFIASISNEVLIGKNCMISNNVKVWGDGHSVLDAKTKKCINLPTTPIVVGDHVWLGERVTITKNAQIPNNCIVGIASVVTKKFTEQNCLIVGVPAQVKKRSIDWHGLPPLIYDEKWQKGEL